MRLYCDNKAAINIAYILIQYDQTKNVEIDWHFIKEKTLSRYHLHTICEDKRTTCGYLEKWSV
jgi:hypothetical protein